MADRRQHHHKVLEIDIDEIEVGETLIPIDQRRVAALAESIADIGLLQPISVSGRRLIAGRHRLLACRALGWSQISAIELTGLDALACEAASLDENLVRGFTRSPAIRAILIARRRALYVAMHPQTETTAARLGALERARARRRGEKMEPPIPGFYVAVAESLGFKPCSIVDILRLEKDLGAATLAKDTPDNN